MKLGRLHNTHTGQTSRSTMPARAVAERRMKAMYVLGLRDGILAALDAVTNAPGFEGEPYTGPIPDELRAYCARARDAAIRQAETP